MNTTIRPTAEEYSDLYFTTEPRVAASRAGMENGTMRTIETYFMERLGPDYAMPFTKFPAALYEELTKGSCPILALLEKQHPDWLYRHYVMVAHTETPANGIGESDIYFCILLENPRSNRLLVEFFEKHQGESKAVDTILAKLKEHADVMDRVYKDYLRHQADPIKPHYFRINSAAI